MSFDEVIWVVSEFKEIKEFSEFSEIENSTLIAIISLTSLNTLFSLCQKKAVQDYPKLLRLLCCDVSC